ncbi:type IV pilin protein [Piscinibacter sakaiensis]|uniref:type IV pilin protein n=1 Tax=Piscinibacter sakaiensis TaxID=1547922 RepID=UPI003AAC6ECA
MKAVLNRGFTLIELMIVVAIVAILATIAFPAYTDYLRRGQIPEAFTHLSDMRVKMEQYYQDNRNYGTSNTCANAAGTNWNFAPVGRKYFDFGCTLTNGGQGFTLRATGKAPRTQGHEYTIDHAGAKATTKFPGVSGSKACWAVKASDC